MKLKDAEKRLKNEPNNLGLRVQVAGLMREAGRSIEAVELYRSVALAYRDQGRTQQAIAVCKSILEIAPEDSACQGLLSLLQARAAMPPPAAPAPRPSRPSRPSRPPVAEPAPAKPPPQSVLMRGSPMPPAPEVPSLRPNTSPPTSPPTNKPIAVGQRPLTPTRPPSRGMEAAGEPARERERPPTRPQQPQPQPAPPRPPLPVQPPPAVPRPVSQAPTRPVHQHDPRASDPARRSSFDSTPLPPAVPYHLNDPTSQPTKVSARDLDDDYTRPDPTPSSGLADAARKISGLIDELSAESRISENVLGVPNEMDVAAELDTRQRRKIASEELNKIAAPPPTLPLERVDDIDDLTTPPPADYDNLVRDRQRAISSPLHRRSSDDALTPTPRGSDDAITQPPRPSNPNITSPSQQNLPRVGPPRTSSQQNLPRVSIPPKSQRPTPSITIPPKRPTPSVPPIASGAAVGKLRPPPPPTSPPPRPAMPKIPRESDEELTRPRERGAPDDDDDR